MESNINKKVYCNNCKWAKYKLVIGTETYYTIDNCGHTSNKRKYDTPFKKEYDYIETFNILNKNNDCQNYKRKWFLFWK